jgi:hypothetical protein
MMVNCNCPKNFNLNSKQTEKEKIFPMPRLEHRSLGGTTKDTSANCDMLKLFLPLKFIFSATYQKM